MHTACYRQSFYDNEQGVQDHFILFWEEVAKRFNNNPYVLGMCVFLLFSCQAKARFTGNSHNFFQVTSLSMSRGQVIYTDIQNSWYQVRSMSLCFHSPCVHVPVFVFQLLQMLGTFSPCIANSIQPSESMMTNTSSSLSLLSSLLVLVKFDL